MLVFVSIVVVVVVVVVVVAMNRVINLLHLYQIMLLSCDVDEVLFIIELISSILLVDY